VRAEGELAASMPHPPSARTFHPGRRWTGRINATPAFGTHLPSWPKAVGATFMAPAASEAQLLASPRSRLVNDLSPRPKICSRKKRREKAVGRGKIVLSERKNTRSGGRSIIRSMGPTREASSFRTYTTLNSKALLSVLGLSSNQALP
jgi:hypothetical protein